MSECCLFSLPRHETGLPGLEFRASKHLGTVGVDYRQAVLTHDAWTGHAMVCFVSHVTPVDLQLHADYILLSIYIYVYIYIYTIH